jgi:Ca2+-binding RTX toxin-like protein
MSVSWRRAPIPGLLRRSALLALAFAAVLLVPSVTSAGTVTFADGKLRYVAADGEANLVTIGQVRHPESGRTWWVRERGAPLLVGPGCTPVDPTTASCGQIWECDDYAEVSLGDFDDSASVGACAGVSIDGGNGNDHLVGGDNEGNGILRGGAGADRLESGGPSWGGPGRDVLIGWASEDVYLYGEAGPDRITLRGVETYEVDVRGGGGDDVLFGPSSGGGRIAGGPGRDRIIGGGGLDAVVGGTGRDYIVGGIGSDRILGDSGADVLLGRGGNDFVTGGAGRDELRGGHGRDTLYARDGYSDRVFGGLGVDRARINRALDLLNSVERLF